MKSYTIGKSHQAHAGARGSEPTRQAPEIERRINTGYHRLLRAILNAPPPVEVRSPKAEGRRGKTVVRSLRRGIRGTEERRPAAADRIASLLCVWLALTLLVTGCAGPGPLKGGKALTRHNPAGAIEQTLVQGENPSQATKQDQESVKVRTYTVPAGSHMEQSLNAECGLRSAEGRKAKAANANAPSQPSTLNSQPSTMFTLSAPMPVVEREETHARTELGAAQKDTARELGAKLSSLKGIVWVGVGLFVFGLASLVWPPLKVVIGSVTTSVALALGGVALMILPSLVVGNELLILGGVGIAVGGWFLAHRHGQLRGMASQMRSADCGVQNSDTAQPQSSGQQAPADKPPGSQSATGSLGVHSAPTE